MLSLGCKNPPAKQTADGLFDQLLQAHGGLDSWKNYKQFSFSLLYERGDQRSEEEFLVDLNNRHERIKGVGYQMGYDGEEYWQLISDSSVSEKNPRFLINLQFYFLSMPFVLADPGVITEEIGKVKLNGREYDGIKATFEEGTGVAPDDQYILYLNPESHQLEYLLYSVTFFNKESAENFNAIHYKTWEKVDGLLMPNLMISYVWDAENQQLGEERSKKFFSQLEFKSEAPNRVNFIKPAGAVAE